MAKEYTNFQTLSQRLVNVPREQLVRDGVAEMIKLGLIRSEKDIPGIGRAMQLSPTLYPRGPINNEQIGDWLHDLRSYNFGGVDMTPNELRPEGQQRGIPGHCGRVVLGLAKETLTANGSRQADTATITLKTALRNVVLWLDTANGLVDQITSLSVDDVDFNLGPSDVLPSLVADMTTEPHPLRTGIFIPYAEEEIVINVSIIGTADDVVWQVVAEAEVVRKGEAAPKVYVGVPYRS